MTPPQSTKSGPRRRWWLLQFAGVTLATLWIGSSYLRVETDRLRREQYDLLGIIGQLKVERIATWRTHRLADARRAAEGPWVTAALSEWRRKPQNRARHDELGRWLANESRAHFSEAMLVRADGRLLLATPGVSVAVDRATRQLVAASLQHREPIFGDLVRDGAGRVHLEAAVAIRDPAGRALAVLVLRADATRDLFPMLEAWPTLSKTSESFMVQVDGPNVVYLNRMRYLGHEALTLTIPLTRTDVPAVQAVLGRRGAFEGTDYRGVRVLADLHAIPGSSWLLLSKVDIDEIMADVASRTWLISAIVAALVLMAATATGYGYRQQQVRHLGRLHTAELREAAAQAQFRTTLYSIGDAVLTTDTQGRVREMNPVAERLTGWPEADARGHAVEEVFSIIDEVSRAPLMNPVRTVLRDGTVQMLANHTLLVARDGTERPIADSAAPIRDHDAVTTGVVLVCSDHSRQHAARKALLESEQALAAILGNLPGMVYRCANDDNWTMFFASEGGGALTGYTAAELTREDGVSYAGLIHPVDRPRVWEEVQAALRSGGAFELEYRMLHRTGAVRWVWERGRVHSTPAGLPAVLEGFVTDITARREAEAQRRLLAAAVNATVDAVAVAECDGTVTWVNAAFTRFTGFAPAEAIGTQLLDCVESVATQPVPRGSPAEALANAREWTGEVTVRRRDGSRFPAALSIAPMRSSNGEVTHFIAVCRDLSDEHAMRAQLLQSQKMESFGQLAGGIAHDFNNLLTVIINGAELAAVGLPGDAPRRVELEEVRRAGERAAALTQQLLAFSRKQIVRPTIMRLDKLVDGMRPMLQRLLGEDVELALADTDGDTQMRADPGQVEQVVLNLVVNARDAMPQGGTITIGTRNVVLDHDAVARYPSVDPGTYVMLTVTDTGSGMDAETRAQVFEPFFTTKELGRGTGLGLSTVYGIVKQSGGSVWVDSVPGAGTTFTLYWPHVAEAPTEGERPPTLTPTRAHETVLIVEDEASILSLVSRILATSGYTVLAATSGTEALAVIDAHEGPVDLLLTDVVMPGMSGSELAALAIARRPGLRVLFVSGYTDDVILRRGVSELTSHLLAKPYTIEGLLRKLREVLNEPDAHPATG